MDNESKARELLSLLRREMNGAVAGSMSEKGMIYGLNYGVSLVDIRRIAEQFAPDHELALHIYGQDVREMRLAAYLIAEPEMVVPDSFPFWGEGITTTELASNGALSLFSKSPYAKDIIFGWLEKETPHMLKYAAVMTATANMMHKNYDIDWCWQQLLEVIFERVWEHTDTESAVYLREAMASLLLRLHQIPEVGAKTVTDYILRIENIKASFGEYLHNVVGWALI